MNAELKKAIRLYIPILLACGIGMYAWQKKATWQVLLIAVAGGWLLSWLMISQALKLIGISASRPGKVDVPVGNIPVNFNAKHWAERIAKDAYAPILGISVRDESLYSELAGMTDAQLVAISNAWLDAFYGEHKEQVYEAIDAEWMVPLSPVWLNRNKLVKRWKTLV